MNGPGGTLIGVSAIGLGALVAYGAYKDVPIFGPSGLLTEAIKTGKLQKVPATVAGAGTAAGTSGSAPNPFLEWTLGVGTKGWFRALTPAGIWTWVFGSGTSGSTPPKSNPTVGLTVK